MDIKIANAIGFDMILRAGMEPRPYNRAVLLVSPERGDVTP